MSALGVLTRPAVRETDDVGLVTRVRAGDERAFELLFLRYQPRIAAYVRGMVADHARAEDITQDIFISALRRMRETDREIVFKPWIYEIAKNACIDAYRRGRTTSEVSFDAHDAIGADEHGRLAEPGATPDAAVEGKLAFDNLRGAFGGLSQVHHEILVMREFEGLSYQEIGERLGMSKPAVESTLFRARKRLSEEYEELVSGERCRRVQRIVDAHGGRSTGLRDQRRMARHLAHCQPCRRYALRSGYDLGRVGRPAAAAARIAALLPLPAFLRRRWSGDGDQLLTHPANPVAHLWANAATVIDPGAASGWAKAVATAATVAVAGVGAGAALTERAALQRSAAGPPAVHAPAVAQQARRSPAAAAPPSRPAAERAWTVSRPAREELSVVPVSAARPVGADAAQPAPRSTPAGRPTDSTASAPTPVDASRRRPTAVAEVLDTVRGRQREPVSVQARPGVALRALRLLKAVTASVVIGAARGQSAAPAAASTGLGGSVSAKVSKTITTTKTALTSLGR